mmetsp:Transcript_13816/g.22870  ORF Transcript_13816/g.22870 Transcript_13816/m.22870 type:complete len:218 (-) Transcript_13816:287-940(-)|eukprot:CAMPEP_0114424108 /NCGR_PEP_ID=MMETSP0103-20121206/6515_1 /TAXON_ID=37642 ORGANISM="Paraphysomonas imperforata, Strain PA2" /NCGR_SAMPLE_ID=MMETSP0103 /ASSEMBLY_ACC=CAM_ASM_000201 /LENGTH=217 /DNA_ID=CAMNT_0001592833 /DNA_START=193 /DNA_END=846 /DNA_ORIENTATION=-
MDEDNEDSVGLTLPVIGKSKSTTHATPDSEHRGTMADIFGNIVTEEELLASQTPPQSKRRAPPPQSLSDDDLISKTANTTPLGSDTGSEKDLSDVKKCPIPPESPLPSGKSFNRAANRTNASKEIHEAVSNVSQMTACMAIDTGLATRKTVIDISELTSNSVIRTALSLGLAKRKSEDISNDYDLERPGCMEAVLASAVTTVALETALKKTSGLHVQ